jgi:beta-mannosidase
VENFTLEEFDGVTGELSYTIQNTGKHPAFMCAFEIEQIKRIFYASDNFFWLNAGESKKVKVSFRLREELLRNQLVFNVSSWNAKTVIKKVKVQ